MSAVPLVPLGEVLSQYMEYTDITEPKMYPKLSVRLYGRGVVLDEPADGSLVKMQRHQLAKAGQVILSEIWGKKGAIGLVPEQGEGALCTSHFFLFDVRAQRLDPRFLSYIFTANYLENQLDAEAKGTTGYAAVRPKHLLAATIPLPPLDEQRRIVARIEELAAKIAEARGLRREVSEEAYILHGRAAAVAIENQAGVEHIAIKHLAEVRGGIQKGPHRTAGQNPVRYLTVAHVHRNHISLDDPRYFEVSPAELDRWRLRAGDVLIIEGNGSADQVGRTAIFRGEIEDCVHQNHVIRLRPNPTAITAEYLNGYLNSPAGQDEMRERSRTTSGLHNLSVGRINEIVVPVPPLPEQHTIVAYLDIVQAKAESLMRLQAETAAELDALLPTVLDRAFRGEL